MKEEVQEWYSLKEFAVIVGISYPIARYAVKCGKIKATNFGQGLRKIWRINKHEVDRLYKDNDNKIVNIKDAT